MGATNRDFSVDALKGFAIACVVLGHVLLRNLAEPESNAVYLLLTAFEMPLFMFLSGYVLAGRIRSPRMQWWTDRALRLMAVFLVWHTIFYATNNWSHMLSGDPLSSAAGMAAYLAHTVSDPSSGLWYLPALVIASGVLTILKPLAARPLVLVVAGWFLVEIAVTGQQVMMPAADFGLLKVQTFWPAFAGGWLWGTWGKRMIGSKAAWASAATVLYIPLAIYGMTVLGELGEHTARALKVALGLAGIGAAAVVVARAEQAARAVRLDRLGQLTLGIYCSHWLFLRIEFGPSLVQIVLGFLFTLTAAGLTSMVLDRSAPLRAVLLGGWRKTTQRKPLHP